MSVILLSFLIDVESDKLYSFKVRWWWFDLAAC